MSEHTDWWEALMDKEGRCPQCENEAWLNDPNTDLSAAQPSSYSHNRHCKKKKK